MTKKYYEFNRNRFILFTLALFIISISIHFVTSYYHFVDDATEHKTPVVFSSFLNEFVRQVFENIQSEMVQTIIQTLGLTLFVVTVATKEKKEDSN